MKTIRKVMLFVFLTLAVATVYRASYSIPILEPEKVIDVVYRGHRVKAAYRLAPVYADKFGGFVLFGWMFFLFLAPGTFVLTQKL